LNRRASSVQHFTSVVARLSDENGEHASQQIVILEKSIKNACNLV